MNRRSFLTASACLAATVPVLAQATVATSPNTDHIKESMTIGALSLLSSREALKRATSPMVQQFASFEVREQEIFADVLVSLKRSEAHAQGMTRSPSDSAVEMGLSPSGRSMLAELRTLQGAAFERAYLKLQLEGHEKLLVAQQSLLQTGGPAPQVNAAKQASGQIQDHLTLLAELRKQG